MKKILLVLFVAMFSVQFTFAQFTENFNDGDFSNNPIWIGQTDSFIVNAKKELQLNAKIAGSSQIALNYNAEQAMVWEFLIRMDFSPSSTNRALIYLIREDISINPPTSGYMLVMGEDGSLDKIKLIRISDNQTLATCGNVFIVNNLVNTRVRVSRDNANNWTIEADYNGAFAFKQEAAFQETNPSLLNKNATFAFKCEYTATRVDKFFFDDIKVSKNEPDVTAPIALSATLDTKIANRVEVVFSEVMDSVLAKNTSLYQLDNGGGSPTKVIYNYDRVSLDFPNLLPATNYKLSVSGLSDLAKNVMSTQTLTFSTSVAPISTLTYDIIINEVMADPIPQIGLPKSEYIELYNRSNKNIDLQGFSVKDKGATYYKLPKFTLKPDAYVIIYKRENSIDFGKYGDTIALTSLFALDSDNEEISLFNEKNELIDHISYGLATYQDVVKADGGWSLECINPNTPCLGASNFRASDDENGGTPGKKNAVFSKNTDTSPLTLTYAFPNTASEIVLQFDKNLDAKTLQNTAFEIETGVQSVVQGTNFNEAKIFLAAPMQKGKVYTLKIFSQIKDCVGNPIALTSVNLGVPEVLTTKDIVINEILFNPKTGGVDFVEIYNRSKKIVNLKGLNIDNTKKLDAKEITTNYLLLPNEYAVLTSNKSTLQTQDYTIKNPNALIETDLPTFDDDEGNVLLYIADAPGKLTIDEMNYEKSYHYPLLKDQNGVSLERINPDGESMDKNNWYSAASAVNFATPTYQNSQFNVAKNGQNELFSLENTRISPDGDGFEDFLLLNYNNTNLVGLTATAKIFDLDGRPVKTLINNELLGNNGAIRWEGDTDEATKAPIGIYVLLVEYFAPDGTVGKEKKVVTVVAKL